MIAATYSYYSPDGGEFGNLPGSLAMQHLRTEPKSFLYRWPNPYTETGWTWRKPPWADYMLYGLEKLSYRVPTAKGSRRAAVYWCEGEADADAINARNLPSVIAVSHHGGAGKATVQQAAYLEGWSGRIIVCADMDPAGAACALARYDLLLAVGLPASRLSICYPAGPFAKSRDVRDHLAEGHSLADLNVQDVATLRARVGRMTPTQRRDGSGGRTGIPDVDGSCLPRDWTPRSLAIEESA